MEGSVVVSKNEQFTHRILEEFRAGKIRKADAAKLLGVSERTLQRKAKRIREKGIMGLKHGNYERSPFNRKDAALKAEMLQLASETYYDFNMVHCLEKLEAEHGLKTSYATFRGWCRSANIGKRKRRRTSKVKVYRERLANQGLMLQMDGSHHKWNGKDEWVLIALIDDATSDIPYAEMFTTEDTWNCMAVLQKVIEIRGRPEAIYTDRAGWFGGIKRQYFSQFVRACEELDIKVIYANSPEAKGRIERAWQTFQDRLIPEMRLRGITSMEAANRYITHDFLPNYWSQRNTVEPRSQESRYRQVEAGVELAEILCMKYSRQVRNDHTLWFENDMYRVTGSFVGSLKGKEIIISQNRSGTLSGHYGHLKIILTKVTRPKKRWSKEVILKVS